ncbi:hypothetical protein BH18ACT9_BH18ACT9_15830 [soil metagenome]
MHDGDKLRARVRGQDAVGVDRRTPLMLDGDDLCAAAGGDLTLPLTEQAVDPHHDHVTFADRVDERRLHACGAGGGVRQRPQIPRAPHRAQHVAGFVHHSQETLGPGARAAAARGRRWPRGRGWTGRAEELAFDDPRAGGSHARKLIEPWRCASPAASATGCSTSSRRGASEPIGRREGPPRKVTTSAATRAYRLSPTRKTARGSAPRRTRTLTTPRGTRMRLARTETATVVSLRTAGFDRPSFSGRGWRRGWRRKARPRRHRGSHRERAVLPRPGGRS